NVSAAVLSLENIAVRKFTPPAVPDVLVAAEGSVLQAPDDQHRLAGQPLRRLCRQLSQPWPRLPDLAGKHSHAKPCLRSWLGSPVLLHDFRSHRVRHSTGPQRFNEKVVLYNRRMHQRGGHEEAEALEEKAVRGPVPGVGKDKTVDPGRVAESQ